MGCQQLKKDAFWPRWRSKAAKPNRGTRHLNRFRIHFLESS